MVVCGRSQEKTRRALAGNVVTLNAATRRSAPNPFHTHSLARRPPQWCDILGHLSSSARYGLPSWCRWFRPLKSLSQTRTMIVKYAQACGQTSRPSSMVRTFYNVTKPFCNAQCTLVTFDSTSQGQLAMVIYEWHDAPYLGKVTSYINDFYPVSYIPRMCAGSKS